MSDPAPDGLDYETPDRPGRGLHPASVHPALLLGSLGFGAGVFFLCAAFLAVGPHGGTTIVIECVSAPLDWFGGYARVFGTPVLWASVGVLLGLGIRRPAWRIAFVVAILLHYVGLTLTLKSGWPPRRGVDSTVVFGLGVYASVQLAVWVIFISNLGHSRRPATNL